MQNVDLNKPYCYQVYRLDTDDPERQRLTFGHSTNPPEDYRIDTAEKLAVYLIGFTRTSRNYNGPIRVHIWAMRDDEHYRNPAPEDAYELTMGLPDPEPEPEPEPDDDPVYARYADRKVDAFMAELAAAGWPVHGDDDVRAATRRLIDQVIGEVTVHITAGPH